MANEEVQVTYLVIDASKAVDGGKQAQRALEALEKQSAQSMMSLASMEKALASIGNTLKAHLVLAIADMVARLGEMLRQAFAAAAGMAELAEQMGYTARGLQGVQFAAVQNGASMEQLEAGLGKFNQKMGEAADGSKPVIDALKALGVQNLDIHGKLRPTEDLLQDVAKAISEIEDPARRAAAAVDFFGKGGRALLPSLKDMSEGMDAMALKAQHFGAMISDHTIKRLDDLADRMEMGKLRTRAFLAEGLVTLIDWYKANENTLRMLPVIGGIITLIENLDKVGPAFQKSFEMAGNGIASLKQAVHDSVIAVMEGFGGMLDMFSRIGENIKNIFVEAMNGMLEAIETGINNAKTWLADSWVGKGVAVVGKTLGLGDPTVALPRIAPSEDNRRMMTYGQEYGRAGRQLFGGERNYRQELDERRQVEFAQWFAAQEAGSAGLKGYTPGASYSRPSGGGGESPDDKWAKLITQTRLAAEAQDKMTEAMAKGEGAVATLKIETDAQAKALDIFGKELDKNDPRLKGLILLLERVAKGKLAEQFNQGTNELRKQNEVLQMQNDLFGKAPELQAKEIALIKAKQEAVKDGIDLESEAYRERLRQVELNERLKIQAEELKTSQQLWLEPLKTALSDIQKAGADAWDQILQSGKISFQSLGDVFKTTVRRMIAEFLTLATVRPIMSVVVQSASQIGLISGSTASALGYGSSNVGGGSFLSGLGNVTMPSWLGGGQPFSFLNNTISGSLPSGVYGPPNAGQGFSSGFLGDITWGQGLGAVAGAGMGIYQLLNSKSTSSTIGGISSIVGAGVSLIPGIGQIAGPAIALLGNLLPGLFGLDGPKQPITNQTYGQLSYSPNGWYTTGGAWGPDANASTAQNALSPLGTGIDAIFKLFGGVKDPSKVWGLATESISKTGSGWDFNSTSSFLLGPNGERELWRMNESDMMSTGASQLARRSILGGAVGEISDKVRAAVDKTGQATSASMEQLATIIAQVMDFEKAMASLGKTALTSEAAFKDLDNRLGGLWGFAKEQGYTEDITKIEAFKETERVRYAQGFMDQFTPAGFDKDLAELQKQKKQALDEAAYLQANLNTRPDLYGQQGLEAYYIDMNKITEFFLQKEADLRKQYYNSSINDLQDVIKRLTMGDLAQLSPTEAAQTIGEQYRATLAKAQAGDSTARGQIAGLANDYASALQTMYGGSGAYQTGRRQIVADLTGLALDSGDPGAASSLSSIVPLVTNLLQQVQALTAQIADSTEQATARDAEIARLNALIQRLVTTTTPG